MDVPPELEGAIRRGGKPIVLSPPITEGSLSGKQRSVLLCRVPNTNLKDAIVPPLTLSHRTNGAIDSDQQTLTLSDAHNLIWLGRKDGGKNVSKSTAFLLIDEGDHWALSPIAGTCTFTPDTEAKVGPQEVDQIERRRRQETSEDGNIKVRVRSEMEASDDPVVVRKRKASDDRTADGPVSLAKMKKEKLRKVLKRKKKEKDLDHEDQAGSSLAFGEVRKAEVDWDFEDKGIASDDEEGAALSDAEIPEADDEDVSDSEEEKEDEVLTNYGENLTRLLEGQKEREADAELEQFSDDEDANDEEKAAKAPQNNMMRPPSGLQSTRPARGDGAAPVSGSESSVPHTEQSIQEAILTLLSRQSEGISVKTLLDELGITARNTRFHMAKKLIGELCDVKSITGADGQVTRCIELKPSKRPTAPKA